MADIIVALIIFSILGLSIFKIFSEKRKGVKCVGCASGSCSSKQSTNKNSKQIDADLIDIKELT